MDITALTQPIESTILRHYLRQYINNNNNNNNNDNKLICNKIIFVKFYSKYITEWRKLRR